jgi:hypothetical protein
MTVANETARTSATGSAAAGQEITFSFPINDTSDLVVKTRVTATGVEATLDETDDYTVSISGDVGGTVTLVDALAITSTAHVIRDTPKTQSLDLEAGGTFSAENVEDALDKNCRQNIDNADAVTRSIRAPSTDPTTCDMELPSSIDRKSNWLYFDADGQPTVAAAVAPTTAVITAAAALVLAKATNAAMAQQLDLEPGVDIQAYDAGLLDIAALAVTNSNFIVGDGTNWVAESAATARTSMGTLAETEACRVDGTHAYTATGVGFRDQDDMLSNDATAPASQQSIVAYINSIVCHEGAVVTHRGNVVTKAATT